MNSLGRSRYAAIYGFSFIVTCVLVTLVGLILGTNALVTMLTLTALEITFSLDNAVVNAQVLERMNAFWRRMFMTVGIFIAVFGMRLLLPIVVVAVTAQLGFWDVVRLALDQPAQYAAALQQAHATIASFGGMFLLMIFLDYVINESSMLRKSLHTIRAAQVGLYLQLSIAAIILAAVCLTVPAERQFNILVAGSVGGAIYLIVRLLSDWFAKTHAKHQHTQKAFVRGGLITFLYLEMLDASFSFDGVVGAFAVTSNVLLIAAGLGVGAVWVRSITIDLVKNGTLRHYPYLDLGAHLAIGSLASMLLIGIGYELPELLTGTLGLVIILVSFLASVVHNRRVAKTGALARTA